MQINNIEISIRGRLIKTARLKEEWYEDLENPESLISQIKKNKIKADIFTFWQRLPETKPKYSYYMEWNSLAAIPINSFEHWFEKQINSGARKAIRKAKKEGVIAKVADLNDEFVKGVTTIFNETPIRQGRPYSHYGENFETVKQEFSKNLDRCDFIGAYYNDELIGFIQLGHAGKCAIPFGMVSKIEHRDKSPQNALVAKAVEICDIKQIPYLLYGYWSRGGLGDFKRHNGCIKMQVPRYYIPLTIKGQIALKFNFHHGISIILPDKLIDYMITLRTKWYSRKYGK